MGKLMHDLNVVRNYYMDKNDSIKVEPVYDSYMSKLPEENAEFLKNLLKFLMYGKMISETTKIYLRGQDRTIGSVFARYNYDNPDKKININTAKSKLNYDRKKLLDYFDDDMVHQIIHYPQTCDLVKYRAALARADARYGKLGTLEKRVNLNLKCSDYIKNVDQDKFQMFMVLIAPYRKGMIATREKLIREEYRDVLSYINYICGGSKLNGNDLTNLDELLRFLSCHELKEKESTTLDDRVE